MKFEELGLSEPILRAVAAEQYTVATPIQIQGIPHVLKGSDLLGCAQTGTGKTAAFALPILHRLSQSKAAAKPEAAHAPQARPHGHGAHASNGHRDRGHRDHPTTAIRALILAPTRELASQIAESFATYGRNLSLKHAVIFGGVSQVHQVRALRRGVDIVIATPGRLLDLMNQGYVDLRSIEIFVLDEADRMLDMGFIHDIRKIVSRIPTHPHRQTLMFSATMPEDIRELAHSILRHPVNVKVSPVASTVETIAQSVYFVPRKNKHALLRHLLQNAGMNRTLVFTRTKHGADKVVKGLLDSNIRAEAIHGNKSQNARTRALDSFKGNKPPVLVATDIASRGIDVDNITHVVNFDIPNVPETYVHRIGRTARAGARGVAISFCDPAEERGDLKAIERLIRQNIDVNTERLTFAPASALRVRHTRLRLNHMRGETTVMLSVRTIATRVRGTHVLGSRTAIAVSDAARDVVREEVVDIVRDLVKDEVVDIVRGEVGGTVVGGAKRNRIAMLIITQVTRRTPSISRGMKALQAANRITSAAVSRATAAANREVTRRDSGVMLPANSN